MKSQDELFGNDVGKTFEFKVDGRFLPSTMNKLLVWAAENKASDTTITGGDYVWCEIGGTKHAVTQKRLTPSEMNDLISVVNDETAVSEIQAGHDLDPAYIVKNKTRDENGRIKVLGIHRFRVNITPTRNPTGGITSSMTFRSLPGTPLSLSDLNIEPAIINNLRPKQGLILVTGPTGSGKSTLMSAIIRHLLESKSNSDKFLEYSSPIEFVYDNVDKHQSFINQVEVGNSLRPRNGGSPWAYAIRNALRRKPDVIILGEARDQETIMGCIEGGLTGHLVYSTMHTIGVAETIRRAVLAMPASQRAAISSDILDVIQMIVSQLLVPKKGGGMCAVREYMVFDQKAKSALRGLDMNQWSHRIGSLLQNGEAVGQTMSQAAYLAFKADHIDADTYEWLSTGGNQSAIERKAIACGLL